jgi:hypothetical protein
MAPAVEINDTPRPMMHIGKVFNENGIKRLLEVGDGRRCIYRADLPALKFVFVDIGFRE